MTKLIAHLCCHLAFMCVLTLAETVDHTEPKPLAPIPNIAIPGSQVPVSTEGRIKNETGSVNGTTNSTHEASSNSKQSQPDTTDKKIVTTTIIPTTPASTSPPTTALPSTTTIAPTKPTTTLAPKPLDNKTNGDPTSSQTKKPADTATTKKPENHTEIHTEDHPSAATPIEPTDRKASASSNVQAPNNPVPQDRSFDGLSFLGGIITTLGLLVIGVLVAKYYRSRVSSPHSYFTL